MKTLIILLFASIGFTAIGQTALNEKQVMQQKHIDFSKEVIYFELSGLMEIDGHTFQNDTCKTPVIYKADLKGIEIWKGSKKYEYRKCNKSDCKIIHLSEINRTLLFEGSSYLIGGHSTPKTYIN